MPAQPRTVDKLASIKRGAYVLVDAADPQAIIIATGSEVEIAVAAAAALAAEGIAVRVVSMPCAEVFEAQDARYRETVLPAAVGKRVAVEAGVTAGWYRYVGSEGRVIGLDRFGESAPADELFKKFGFTAEHVKAAVQELI